MERVRRMVGRRAKNEGDRQTLFGSAAGGIPLADAGFTDFLLDFTYTAY